ncbi:MAG: TPM domain-containing protein [Clostridia bacterium]|nr:TPM domain-containing protein [Clostridia bacterium]
MKKRSLFICLVALAAALLTAALASVSAFASSGTDKYGYVVDGADILTSAEEAELSAYLKEKSEKAGCDIIVVTTDDLGGKSMMEYADDFYDYNGYSDDGVIFLRYFKSEYEYDSWISTSGKMIRRVNADSVFDAITDDFRYQEYLSAFKTYGRMCASSVSVPFVKYLLISAVIGLIAAAIHIGKLKRELVSVESRQEANDYIVPNSMKLTNQQDVYLYSTVTRVRRESSSSSGGGSHTSSSGRSHGGGGRHI